MADDNDNGDMEKAGCLCKEKPKTCCIKMSWREDAPTFEFSVGQTDRRLEASPERIDVELVSTAGRTAGCHLIQSVHQKLLYTSTPDAFNRRGLPKASPRHPKLVVKWSDTRAILDDPRDYNEALNLINAAGNVCFNDRPADEITRNTLKAPIVFDVETVYAVWCSEEPSIKATWGYGWTIDWDAMTGHFYRWVNDCDQGFRLGQWEAKV